MYLTATIGLWLLTSESKDFGCSPMYLGLRRLVEGFEIAQKALDFAGNTPAPIYVIFHA